MKVIVDNYNNACARVICNGCESVLEFVKGDIQRFIDNTGRFETYVFCPLCKHQIHVDEQDLKSNIYGKNL